MVPEDGPVIVRNNLGRCRCSRGVLGFYRYTEDTAVQRSLEWIAGVIGGEQGEGWKGFSANANYLLRVHSYPHYCLKYK